MNEDKKDSKEQVMTLFLIIIMVAVFLLGIKLIIDEYSEDKLVSDCMQKIAEDYCREKGLIFVNVMDNKCCFRCKADSREIRGVDFLFLEGEYENCKEEETKEIKGK
jgi:hypothetical protein